MKKALSLLLALALLLSLGACVMSAAPAQNAAPKTDLNVLPSPEPSESAQPQETEPAAAIDENGVYDSKDEVALYLHTYGHLPRNYITKDEAKALGWSGGSVEKYAEGKCIGGDRFGNYEKLLPEGKNYRECDLNTLGASGRGAERLIYSDDGYIYYTGDHYESFTELYGGE